MSLRHPGQNPGRRQGYLSQDSRVVPPPRFAGCRRGSAAAQSEQERLIRADAGWGSLLQAAVRPSEAWKHQGSHCGYKDENMRASWAAFAFSVPGVGEIPGGCQTNVGWIFSFFGCPGSSLWCTGFSCCKSRALELGLRSRGSWAQLVTRGIFPDHGSNLRSLLWKADS